MAAEMMYADGKATMISKDGDAYGTNFRYNNIEYEKDMQSGRCYLIEKKKNFHLCGLVNSQFLPKV